MGKYKSRKYKLHTSAPSEKSEHDVNILQKEAKRGISVPQLEANIFEGIDIFSSLKDAPMKPFDDDTRSVKSYVSSKSINGENVIPKKERRKLKRQFLLKKIDTVNQMKKDLKQTKKEKEQTGLMMNLLESLPVLEPSLTTNNTKQSRTHHMVSKKKKAMEKSRKIQKKTTQNVNIYKKLLKNPALVKDPFGTISEHLKVVVEKERKAVGILKNKSVNEC